MTCIIATQAAKQIRLAGFVVEWEDAGIRVRSKVHVGQFSRNVLIAFQDKIGSLVLKSDIAKAITK